MARGKRNTSKKANFFNLMSEEVPEDVALNTRKSTQTFDADADRRETVRETPKPVTQDKDKPSFLKKAFGVGGRTRSQMEDEIESYGEVRDEVERYVPAEEKQLIYTTLKGITSPNDIIDKAEVEGLEIQNLIYLNIITKNDYSKYLSYVGATEAELQRQERLKREEERRKEEKRQREIEKLRKEREREEELQRIKEEEEAKEREALESLKGRIGQPVKQPEPEPEIEPQPQSQPEQEKGDESEPASFDFNFGQLADDDFDNDFDGDFGSESEQESETEQEPKEDIEDGYIVKYRGTVDEVRIKVEDDKIIKDESVDSALDNYLSGSKPKKEKPLVDLSESSDSNGNKEDTDNEVENKFTPQGKENEEYNQELTKFDNVKTEVESQKEDEREIKEHERMDIYIVGDLYKILKNSGVGNKTPGGYRIEPEDEEKHFHENLKNYNIVLIETEEGLNDYLFSKNNLLIVTQDVGKLVKNRLAGFLRGTGEEEGDFHRIVTIKGEDTEVGHSSIEDSIILTGESLDRYYDTHPIENYFSEKKGFSSLDSLLYD